MMWEERERRSLVKEGMREGAAYCVQMQNSWDGEVLFEALYGCHSPSLEVEGVVPACGEQMDGSGFSLRISNSDGTEFELDYSCCLWGADLGMWMFRRWTESVVFGTGATILSADDTGASRASGRGTESMSGSQAGASLLRRRCC
eukprot:1996352-Rhodomonas_salina.1